MRRIVEVYSQMFYGREHEGVAELVGLTSEASEEDFILKFNQVMQFII